MRNVYMAVPIHPGPIGFMFTEYNIHLILMNNITIFKMIADFNMVVY